MELYKKYKSLFEKYLVNTILRIVHFMAQIEHESHLKPISENLNYSKEGLLKIFSKYFTKDTILVDPKTKKESIIYGTAHNYARQPEKIANRVYANRMGNGDEKSGDGWKYRGRGFIQLTGKDNYKNLSKDTEIDFIKNPDLLLEEPNAIIASLWFWNKNNINKFADKDDIEGVTKIINGGYNGLEDRKKLLAKYKKGL